MRDATLVGGAAIWVALVALSVALPIAACGGRGCSGGAEGERAERSDAGSGSAPRERAPAPEPAVGTGQGSGGAVVGAPPAALHLPATGSLMALPFGEAVILRAHRDLITVEQAPPVRLERGWAVGGDRASLRERLVWSVREAADAAWFAAVARGVDPDDLGDEHAVPVLVEAEAALPAGTLFDVLTALEVADQPAFLVGRGPDGEPHWVRHAREGEPWRWVPSAPPPGREPRDAVADDEGEEVRDEVPPPAQDYAVVGPGAETPLGAAEPGPDWSDRRVPIHLSVLPAGIWLTAGTVERPLTGYATTGSPRDREHPNVRALARFEAGTDPAGWLDWAALQRELHRLRAESIAYRLQPLVEVGVAEDLPVALLVRVLDVAWLDVGSDARQEGGAAFEAALVEGRGEPGLLPAPELALPDPAEALELVPPGAPAPVPPE